MTDIKVGDQVIVTDNVGHRLKMNSIAVVRIVEEEGCELLGTCEDGWDEVTEEIIQWLAYAEFRKATKLDKALK